MSYREDGVKVMSCPLRIIKTWINKKARLEKNYDSSEWVVLLIVVDNGLVFSFFEAYVSIRPSLSTLSRIPNNTSAET